MPAKRSITMEDSSFFTRLIVIKIEIKPVASAKNSIPIVPRDKSIPKIAPSDAEDDTPRISGVARGFENKLWKTIPATVRPLPTIRAVKILGNLILKIKDSIMGSISLFNMKFLKVKIISDILISILPIERAKIPQTRGRIIKII